jgi:glucose/arabinose dehydrogenase
MAVIEYHVYAGIVRCFLALALVLPACHKGPPESAKLPDAPTVEAKKHPVGELLTGEAALGDWTSDAPGVRRRITVNDLPPPHATPSAENGPHVVKRPEGAWPKAQAGWEVTLFAEKLSNPRQMRTAPNGDLFVVESKPERVRVLRGKTSSVFAEGLRQPFGVAFWPPGPSPQWVYVANTDSVVRYPYASGDLVARGASEVVVADLSGGGKLRGGGHWTRDVVFSKDGSKMWVSVGSRSNNSDDDKEARRARIFEYAPDGKNERVYATGIRNAVGLAVEPTTGKLWASVNERDELGDQLVPDYVTHVDDGGFYGWPWFYIGAHEDPAHVGEHPELRGKVLIPDVLLQSHSASLGMVFGDGGAYAAEHGSWNRARRTGYKVVFIPLVNGVATGEYVDFLTGFVTPEGDVWGRPVGVAIGSDGAVYVTDDGGDCVWRVARKS